MILFSFVIVLVSILISVLLQKKAGREKGKGHGEYDEFHPSKLETMVDESDLKPKKGWTYEERQKHGGRAPGTYEAEFYQDPTKTGIKGIEHGLEKARERMPGPRKLKEKAGTMFRNVRNMTVNAIDNTVGLPIAHYQNWKTAHYLKKHPDTKNPILYLMHGLAQNIGSQWRLASQARDIGLHPYHLKGKHHLGDEGAAKDAFHQIEHLHHDTHLTEPHRRKDYFSGHNSGGNVGIEMAGDEKIKKYGIHHVQARAPTPHGFKKAQTIEQKAAGMIIDIEGENIGKSKTAREAALRRHEREPHVPVYIVSGREDALVPPDDTVYKHAKGYHVLKHPHATHFGTSGAHKEVNKKTLELLVDPNLYRPVDWYQKKPESVAAHKKDFFGRGKEARKEMEQWTKEREKYHGKSVHYHHAPKHASGHKEHGHKEHAGHGH